MTKYEVERFGTASGTPVDIVLIKHGSLAISYDGLSIQVDPVAEHGKSTDYAKEVPKADVILVDFHAEGTSEKIAMAYMLDGKASAVWGTHTHVQTSDARILPKGTGTITDLGMTGPLESVLGIDPEQSIGKFLGDPPMRYNSAKGPCKLEGCLFDIDPETGRCRRAEAIRLI